MSRLKQRKFMLLLILTLLIRIPRNGMISGYDAFRLSWFAWGYVNNTADSFLLHPLSLVGAYPLSGYPKFTELILAVYLFISNNIFIGWYLTSLTIGLIGLISFYKMLKDFEININLVYLATFFYVSNANFLVLNTGTVNARASFIALLPLFINQLYLLVSKSNVRNLIGFCLSFVLLLLTHRVSFLFIPVFLGTILVLIPLKYKVNYSNLMYKLALYLTPYRLRVFSAICFVLYPILGIISTFVLPIPLDPIGQTGIFSVSPGLSAFIELTIDQILRQGIGMILSLLFIAFHILVGFDTFDKIENGSKLKVLYIFSLFYLLVCFAVYAVAFYVAMLLILPLSILSAYNIVFFMSSEYSHRKLLSIFFVTINFYAILMIYGLQIFKPVIEIWLFLYAILLVPLALINTVSIFEFNNRQQTSLTGMIIVLLLTITVLNSMYYSDTFTVASPTPFPYRYVSPEEIQIMDFLNDLEPTGRSLASQYSIGLRFMGLTGYLFYADDFGATGLQSGYINASYIEDNSELYPVTEWWTDFYIFETNFSEGLINENWGAIFRKSADHPTNLELFEQENTQYVILLNSKLVVRGTKVLRDSPFVISVIDGGLGIPLLETEHFTIYQLTQSIN